MVDWMMRLINGEKDWKHVSMQNVVILNTWCDVACSSCHTSQLLFSEQPAFGEKQYTYTFNQMNKMCIS